MLKRKYLKHFSRIQAFLSNIGRTKPHLDILNESLSYFNENLSSMLSLLMPEWKRELPMLVGPSPSAAFVEMAGRGQLFEDYVDKLFGGQLAHGVQSHRIQWYLISQEFGPIALELYKVSLDPLWANSATPTMWDLIVDGSSDDEFDFTQPGKLHRYLVGQYVSSAGVQNYLRDWLRQEQGSFAERERELSMAKRESARPALPEGPTHDGNRNTWSGWMEQKQERGPNMWEPTILQRPPDLESEWERYSVKVRPRK